MHIPQHDVVEFLAFVIMNPEADVKVWHVWKAKVDKKSIY